MKLYTTVLTERGKELGKGANGDILIVLTAEIQGKRQEIASMSVVVTKEGYNFQYKLPNATKGEIKIKG